jgi:hypothetical protein
MQAGERFFEFCQREVPLAAVGEQFVALFEIFVDEHQLREFDGASSGEDFIMLHRPGAACQRKSEQRMVQQSMDHSFHLSFSHQGARKVGPFLSTQHQKLYTKNAIFTTATGEFPTLAVRGGDFSKGKVIRRL